MDSMRTRKDRLYKKDPIRTEEFNNRNRKYSRGNQQQISGCRRTDQQSGKQVSGNHPMRTAKRKNE